MAARFLRLKRLLLVLLAPWVAACGTGKPTIPEELLPCEDCDACEDCDTEGYPEGPYGTEVGSTMGNLEFVGYVAPDVALTLEDIALRDFYDPDGSRGIQLLLINTAAAWCQPCQIEHAELPLRAEEYEADGLVILSLLFQDASGDPAKESTLDAWTQTFGTNFPMALDPSYQMGLYGPAETPPLNLVVDPRDMTILARFIGNQDGPMWEFIERTLAERNAP